MLISSCASNKVRRKAESSSSQAKIVRIGTESLKTFPSRPEKGTNGLTFFPLERKIKQWIRISARKQPRGPVLSKCQIAVSAALTSSFESCDKHLKTPQKRRNRPNGQQKPGKVSILLFS